VDRAAPRWPVILVWELPLAGEIAAVPGIRRAAAAALAGWGLGDQAQDVVLLIGEVVTNAVIHAGGGPAGLRVTLDDGAGILRCEVTDASPRPPRGGPAADDDEGGRGLMLVEALASSHGWHPAAGGKTVWFTCGISRGQGGWPGPAGAEPGRRGQGRAPGSRVSGTAAAVISSQS
jgi:anti-sigma regulatory factor (Ser/Thr protein kinase)